jgi:competence protein ComEA
MAVEVTGGPGREGIYFLPEKMTVEEVLLIAGIPITDCLKKINRGGISAGSALMVSPQGEVKIVEMAAARRLALGLPIDINQASQEDLLLVPGIGEKTAYRIIQLRKQRGTFRDLSDLVVVPGIKEKKLNGLKRYLIAGQAP